VGVALLTGLHSKLPSIGLAWLFISPTPSSTRDAQNVAREILVREDKKVLLPKNWIHAFLYSKLTTRA
jgi:hypothetical protein